MKDYKLGQVLRINTPKAINDKLVSQYCKIIDFIPAEEKPTRMQLNLYWGVTREHWMEEAVKSDRIIGKKFNGSYLILPMNGRGKKFSIDLLGEES